MITASGIRGIYGESLTINLAYRLAKAFAKEWNVKSVIVGRDTRPSSEPLEHAIISSLIESGCRVYVAGIQPTPVILWACREMKVNGAVIITASHNPPEWNALKFASTEGLLLDTDDINKLSKVVYGRADKEVEGFEFKKPLTFDPLELYINAALKHLNVRAISKCNLKVVIDPGGGAGFRATPLLLRKLGCKVITINSTPGIFSRKIEPSPDALKELSMAVKAYNADVGFAHDADADRLVCVTDEGEVLAEDYGLAIASLHVLSSRKGPLVVSVASSMIFKWMAEQMGIELHWSPVGEAKVVRAIIKHKAPIGGEGSSGGIIPAFFNLARDGVFGAAIIVEVLALRECKISDIVKGMPRYYQAKDAVPCSPSRYEAIMNRLINEVKGTEVDLIDGVKIWLKDGWVLIRPSQTEPKIRILCEASSRDKAYSLLREYKRLVEEFTEGG